MCIVYPCKIWQDAERAILEAVNNTKDNDTIAAIVGAAVGHTMD